MFQALQGSAGQNRATYLIAQIVYTGVLLAPIWITGLLWTLRSPAARRFRPVGIACAIAIAFYLVAGGKAYYPGAVFTFLFAAGAVPLERRLAARRPLAGRISPAALAGTALVAASVLSLPVALPVLPASTLHSVPLQKINYDLGEDHRLAAGRSALVAREYDSLPGRAAPADHHPRGQLRRGWRPEPVPGLGGPARSLQRRQQLLALGPAARRLLQSRW